MDKQEKKKISKIADEAAKILKDHPELKYFEAIAKAKEIYKEAK